MAIDSFRGEYEFLSNFYEAPVHYEYNYGSNEAAFQSRKSTNFRDRLDFTSYRPSESKKFGRKVNLRADWESVKVDFMRDIVYAKFLQNPELAEKLLATGDAELIEGNHWHDTFWGVDSKTGAGKNWLGKILMEVRANLGRLDAKIHSGEKIWFTRYTVPEMAAHEFTYSIGLKFAQRFEIEGKGSHGVNECNYSVRGRNFVDLSFRDGEKISEISESTGYQRYADGAELRRHADGTKFIYQYEDVPVFDSGDAEWDRIDEWIFYRDADGINLIRCRHGWAIPKINIYLGLKEIPAKLEKILCEI